MKSIRTLSFFALLFQLLVVSCSKCDNNDKVIGQYATEIKGIVIKDSTKGRDAAKFLHLNKDNTFTLYKEYDKVGVSGEWKILSCKIVENNLGERVPEFILEFKINNQENKATYRDRRIIFGYPEDLYGGRYRSLTYVNLNKMK